MRGTMTKKTTPKAKAKAAKTAAARKEYSPELAEKVLALYVSGMPLEEIETLPEMPARRDVFRWKRQNSEFAAEYEDARNLVGDGAVDTAQSIPRKAIAGEIEPRDARDIEDRKSVV